MAVASGWAGWVLAQQLICELNVHLRTLNTREVVGVGHVSRWLPVIVPTKFNWCCDRIFSLLNGPYCDEACAACGSIAGQLIFTWKLNMLPAKFTSGICQLASFPRHCPAFHRLQYTYLPATESSAGGQGTRVLLQYSMLIRMLLAENHSLLPQILFAKNCRTWDFGTEIGLRSALLVSNFEIFPGAMPLDTMHDM